MKAERTPRTAPAIELMQLIDKIGKDEIIDRCNAHDALVRALGLAYKRLKCLAKVDKNKYFCLAITQAQYENTLKSIVLALSNAGEWENIREAGEEV